MKRRQQSEARLGEWLRGHLSAAMLAVPGYDVSKNRRFTASPAAYERMLATAKLQPATS